MKKSLLLLTLACFLFAGSQLSFAQNADENQKTTLNNTDDSAKKETLKIINLLKREYKVENTQKNKIYDIFVAVNKKKANIANIENAAEQKAKLTKLQDYVDQKLQQVLTNEQYVLYKKKMVAH